MDELMRLKAAAAEQGCDYLTWNDIQACIDQVNLTVQEEHERKETLTNNFSLCKPQSTVCLLFFLKK